MKRRKYVHVALSLLLFAVLLQAQTLTPESKLTIVSPNEEEVWTNGEVQFIQWTYDGVETPRMFTVQLSTDRVKYFVTIVAGLSSDSHEYKWRVNVPDSKNCLIRVTAQVPLAKRVLPAFRNVADVSDARFQIVTGAVTPPAIIQR
jgi:hypothetical protein